MGKKTILIAEDELIISENIKHTLERHGYAVPSIAVTSEEVIVKAFAVKPDLLLIDVALKGALDGIEAAKQVYKKLNIPIIYLSAHGDEKTIGRAKETEPYGYLIKPYNERDLLIAIEIALLHYQPCIKMLEEKCRNLVEAAPDPIIISDNTGEIILVNKRTEEVFGYTWSEMLGKPIEMLLPERFRDAHLSQRKTYYENPSVRPMGVWRDLSAERKNGTEFPVSINLSTIETKEGLYVISVVRDTTETKRAEAEFALLQDIAHDITEARDFSSALEVVLRKTCEKTGWLMGEIWLPSSDGSHLELNPAWYCNNCDLKGFREASKKFTFLPGTGLPGRVWVSKQALWIQNVANDKNFARTELAKKAGIKACVGIPVLAREAVVAVMTFFIREEKKEDSRFIRLVSSVAAQLGIFIQHKLTEERITYLAYYDLLTDLPNRLMLHDTIEDTIASAKKQGKPFALLIIDLDHFRDINEALGHHRGDALLMSIAYRLKNIFANTGTVSRLGGDDFTVILPGADLDSVSRHVDTISKSLDEPFLVEDIPLNTTVCIGVSFFPEHGEDAHTLLRKADIALHEARKQGGRFVVYSPHYDRFSPGQLALIGELKHAIDSNQLFLLYQPKIDLKTNTTIGAEVLVRWRHPTKGVISPDQFIFLAEHSGLIKQLTLWVIRETLRQVHSWSQTGIEASSLAVNLSIKDLHTSLLLEQTRKFLSQFGIDPKRLRFEITESLMMEDHKLTTEMLTKLTQMGICFSIDDFGTGYSSLSYLQRLPVDEIKIDRSFVLKMATDECSMKIVVGIIKLAHSLGLKVAAEGVDNQEILDKLVALECDAVQGYLLSRPIPPDEFAVWLTKHG